MTDNDDVGGRVGDVSGRVGDVSGRVGDVSGRVGDVSGVSGRVGDVSGLSTLLDVKDFLMQDRGDDRIDCLELRVRRLQNEILGVARWLDARLRILEASSSGLKALEQRVTRLEGSAGTINDSLKKLDERVKKLEHPNP